MSFKKGLAVFIYAGKKYVINLEVFICFVLVDSNLDPFKLRTIWKIKGIKKIMFTDIRKLIYEEPIDRVPLYISTYPIVVSWRLDMGK
jgi:hypothetical protein